MEEKGEVVVPMGKDAGPLVSYGDKEGQKRKFLKNRVNVENTSSNVAQKS